MVCHAVSAVGLRRHHSDTKFIGGIFFPESGVCITWCARVTQAERGLGVHVQQRRADGRLLPRQRRLHGSRVARVLQRLPPLRAAPRGDRHARQSVSTSHFRRLSPAAHARAAALTIVNSTISQMNEHGTGGHLGPE